MYKCRYCPHVNFRKANIQEHEKMHTDRTKENNSHNDSGGKVQPSTNLVQHHCPECNYICNNAGVLSSHAKVHQGFYGQIHALVDTSRTDEAQLEELSATVNSESAISTNTQPVSNIKSEHNDNSDANKGMTKSGDSHETSIQDENTESVLKAQEHISESNSDVRILYFCSRCPARFLCEKELKIHRRYHVLRLPHHCEWCSYTAKQRSYLLAHLKVHTEEYQEKTDTLTETCDLCQEHPRPQTVVENSDASSKVWVVNDKEGKKERRVDTRGSDKHYACDRCPAKFLKSDSLHYHISMHGGHGQYKCKYCDYTAKTFGHLVKHEDVHQDNILLEPGSSPLSAHEASFENASHNKGCSQSSTAGQKRNAQKVSAEKTNSSQSATKDRPPLHVDPQFGILMHGNPDFIYPTYLKNGRLKQKRYKCHKCPSAFEKREQYRTHLTLHGAKQRYKCEICDYSVKYYANYIQHMRKHKDNDDAQAARLLENKLSEPESTEIKKEIIELEQLPETRAETQQEKVHIQEQEEEDQQQQQQEEKEQPQQPSPQQEQEPEAKAEEEPEIELKVEPEQLEQEPEQEPLLQTEETNDSAGSHSVKSIGSPKKPGPIEMSVADRQILMLLQIRHAENLKAAQETVKEQLQKSYWCPHCPYSTPRRDGLEIHIRRHTSASGIYCSYTCEYCDYSVPSAHFLQEHHKLHFAQKRFATECFMKSRSIQIWKQENNEIGSGEICNDNSSGEYEKSEKELVFKDKGISVEVQNRFEPDLAVESDCITVETNTEDKTLIDLTVGEPFNLQLAHQDTDDTSLQRELLGELDLITKKIVTDTEIPHEIKCVIKQEMPDSPEAEDDYVTNNADEMVESTEYLKCIKEDLCIS